jgi:hypothetical protein
VLVGLTSSGFGWVGSPSSKKSRLQVWVWRWVEHRAQFMDVGTLLGPEGTPCSGCFFWPLALVA